MKHVLEETRQSPAAFYDQLVQEHYDFVLGYIQSRMADKDRTQDVAQEAFLVAWTRISELYEHPNVRAWLLRTAHHKMQHLFRDDKKESNAVAAAMANHADEHLDEQDAAELLALLNDQDSAVLLMYYEEGLSIAEIAKTLDITVDAAKMRLSRARRKLENIAKSKNLIKYFLLMCYLWLFFWNI